MLAVEPILPGALTPFPEIMADLAQKPRKQTAGSSAPATLDPHPRKVRIEGYWTIQASCDPILALEARFLETLCVHLASIARLAY